MYLNSKVQKYFYTKIQTGIHHHSRKRKRRSRKKYCRLRSCLLLCTARRIRCYTRRRYSADDNRQYSKLARQRNRSSNYPSKKRRNWKLWITCRIRRIWFDFCRYAASFNDAIRRHLRYFWYGVDSDKTVYFRLQFPHALYWHIKKCDEPE